MRTNLRKCWPAFFLAAVMLCGPLPVLAADSQAVVDSNVVELEPEAYTIPVYIEDPLVPAGADSTDTSAWAFDLLTPVFIGMATIGFPSWGA